MITYPPLNTLWLDIMPRPMEMIDESDFRSLDLKRVKRTYEVDSDWGFFFTRRGRYLYCELQLNYDYDGWKEDFGLAAFSRALARSVRRHRPAQNTMSEPRSLSLEDGGHDYCVGWLLKLPLMTSPEKVLSAVAHSYQSIHQTALRLVGEDQESVLVLGKDTGRELARLRRICRCLEELGYEAQLIKDLPDRTGESVIQKVLRHGLRSKFIVVENTRASGHLYELPHLKFAECVTLILQEKGKGSTWMFEDAYAKLTSWKKFQFEPRQVTKTVAQAARWAEQKIVEFECHQKRVLPWRRRRNTANRANDPTAGLR